MRIALFSPFNSGPLRGNMITVQRIASHLPATGCQVLTIPLDTASEQQIQQQLEQHRPDLLHAFHAFHSGPTARRLALQLKQPYLITMTGSDLHDPALASHPDTLQALHDAAAITCFDQLAAAQLTDRFPPLNDRVAIIAQGVTPLSSAQPYPRHEGWFIILLPAALRPVKGVLEAMQALSPLAKDLPHLRLWIAGGDLDPAYAALVRQQAAALPWVRLLGEVPHERMGDLFAACDLVLNYSRFEGGMANTLLEAMAAGKPVAASDVPGNRSLIRHGQTGWLFKDQHQLHQLLERLPDDPSLLTDTGQRARKMVISQFSPQQEASRLAALYHRLVARHHT